MCRLYAFRSIINSSAHTSLVAADNALKEQSNHHPDGWGVAYFIDDTPHLVRSISEARKDNLFHRVSGIVSSQTLLAHLRKATMGEVNILNTHPFQYGRWIFAHNGNITNFQLQRKKLVPHVAPILRRFMLGDTDSELIFYLILSCLAKHVNLSRPAVDVEAVMEACKEAVAIITNISGPFCQDDGATPDNTFLTFIITNGTTMVAHQGGKNLFYSTYKQNCSDRDTCPYFAPECESPSTSGYVNHLIFTSEPIQSENIWHPLVPGQMVGVDNRMLVKVDSSI